MVQDELLRVSPAREDVSRRGDHGPVAAHGGRPRSLRARAANATLSSIRASHRAAPRARGRGRGREVTRRVGYPLMRTCSTCGVEVEEDGRRCPCAGPPPGGAGGASPREGKGREPEVSEASVRRWLWEVISLLALTAAAIVLAIDLASGFDVTWSLYPLSAVAFLWICATSAIALARRPLALFAALAAAVVAFLFVLELITGGRPWFLPLALPLVGLAIVRERRGLGRRAPVPPLAASRARRRRARLRARRDRGRVHPEPELCSPARWSAGRSSSWPARFRCSSRCCSSTSGSRNGTRTSAGCSICDRMRRTRHCESRESEARRSRVAENRRPSFVTGAAHLVLATWLDKQLLFILAADPVLDRASWDPGTSRPVGAPRWGFTGEGFGRACACSFPSRRRGAPRHRGVRASRGHPGSSRGASSSSRALPRVGPRAAVPRRRAPRRQSPKGRPPAGWAIILVTVPPVRRRPPALDPARHRRRAHGRDHHLRLLPEPATSTRSDSSMAGSAASRTSSCSAAIPSPVLIEAAYGPEPARERTDPRTRTGSDWTTPPRSTRPPSRIPPLRASGSASP